MKLYAAPLDFAPIVEEFSITRDFPTAVETEARAAQDRFADARRDARDIELVTIDPVGSMDLDQAVCIVRHTDAGTAPQSAESVAFTVYYAIADVAAFVEPGGAVEAESFKRGQTIYLPDGPARLHPAALSEDKASLLPDQDRPAILWTFHLDAQGEVIDFDLERALVRSRARLDYGGVHADLAAGTLHPSIAALADVGRLRQASSLRREAINLRLPSQRVVEFEQDGQARFELQIEPRFEVMDFNSELSLLTGMCAGEIVARAGRGFLRTLAPATEESAADFAKEARALGFDLQGRSISEFLQQLDADSPRGMAMMRDAQRLLRGADYVWVEEAHPLDLEDDAALTHAGIGGFYAHVTAPLRRLADRFATEACLALHHEEEVPAWVLARTEEVCETMRRTGAVASGVDKACLKLTEATVLAPWVGDNFEAVIVETHPGKAPKASKDGKPAAGSARGFVAHPPIFADIACSPGEGVPAEGSDTLITLVAADPAARQVSFAWPAD